MISQTDLEYLRKRKFELVDSCPICHGTKAFCSCQYAFQFEYTKIRANIPLSLRSAKLDDVTNVRLRKMVEYARQYVELYRTGQKVPNLILSSGRVRPAQVVATHILLEALRAKHTGYFFPSILELKTAATKNWNPNEKKDIDCVALNTYDIIVIDGCGTNSFVESAVSTEIKDIIKSRYATGKLTLFISFTDFAHLPEIEKELLGSCKAAEMCFHNWECTEDPVEAYTVPTIIGMEEEEARERARLEHLQKTEEELKALDFPKRKRGQVPSYLHVKKTKAKKTVKTVEQKARQAKKDLKHSLVKKPTSTTRAAGTRK